MKSKRICVLAIVVLTFSFIMLEKACAENNIVIIHINKQIGQVNKKLFGNNLIGYDPMPHENWAKEYYGYSEYGAGVWDPKLGRPVETLINLAKTSGISALRFPGGCGSHHYDWKKAVGKRRQHFLFGIDEFLKVCKQIHAEPVLTLSYFTGDLKDAADLIEYLNSPDDGNNPNGGINWASARADNGHKEPYGVKYFEFGNEDWHGDHRKVKEVTPGDYALKYLKYYAAMKAVDPSIKIGALLWTPEWNAAVMDIIKDKIDFGIVHTYPTPAWGKPLEAMAPKDIYAISFAKAIMEDERLYQETLKLLKAKSGRDIPLAITEYNGGFEQDKPVPYRHCLGTALLNAELLRIFMRPLNNILMGNYWIFANDYWGMITNGFDGDPRDLYRPYHKRPNYYVFEMYHEHFGDILLETKVKSDSYDGSMYRPFYEEFIKRIMPGKVIKTNLLRGKWRIENIPGVTAKENGTVLEITFVDPQTFNYCHAIKIASVTPATHYKVSGYIKTDNLRDEQGVCLEVQDGRGWDATHSAEATAKVAGTEDWRYVETIYKTLVDAKSVMVLARRVGEKGPLKGKAFFKNVKLEKCVPNSADLDLMRVPYLSVNASKRLDGRKVYLMVINKNVDAQMTAMITLKDFAPASKGNAWVLNGPRVDSTNEKKHDNVKVWQHEFEIRGNSFEFAFKPHSLTAIEIERSGVVDGQK